MATFSPRPRGGTSLELWAWYYMRVSGVLVLFLVLGHVALVHLINSVDVIDYAFVATRWQNLGWRLYDWLLLFLALTHGVFGLRVLVDDYVHRRGARVLALSALWVFFFLFLTIGTLTIVTFPQMPGLVARAA